MAAAFRLVVRTVPSLCGPVNSLTVIVLVVAANQPCANVDSWSLPKSQRGVNLSEGVRPPGKCGYIFDVWADFRFLYRSRVSFDSRFAIDFGLWWWHWIIIILIQTKYYATKILNTVRDSKCRISQQFDETIDHIISVCFHFNVRYLYWWRLTGQLRRLETALNRIGSLKFRVGT